jgi:hypothetical protein
MKNNSILNSLVLAKANTKRTALALLLGFATFSLAVGGMTLTARAEDEKPAPIEGAWISTIEIPGLSFTTLASFSAGGVFFGTGSHDRSAPILNSTLTGAWKRTGPNQYAVTAYFFGFDTAGNAITMLKTNEVLHLTGPNEAVGTLVVFACDLQGNNCVSLSSEPGRGTGRRIVVE